MRKELLIFILILTFKFSSGQQFTDLYGDYLGQTPPGDTPAVFLPGIISTSNLEHSAAIFSSDGDEVYWSSMEFPISQNKAKLLRMSRINNRWTRPEILIPFGDKVICGNPFLSIDDKRLYFDAESDTTSKNVDIWFIEKQDNGWSKPQNLSPVINTAEIQAQASLNSEGTVYYLNAKGNNGPFFILRSKYKNGNYLQPDSLPESINSPSMDWTPYIARDDSYLIFSSTRGGGYGSGDLYISYHDFDDDTWTEPVNMGGLINSGTMERLPYVSPDGMYLFFTRWTEENDQDVFWVSAKIIDRLKGKSNTRK